MVRSTRIIHNNEEFLVQDKNPAAPSRSITFLARPGSSTFALPTRRLVKTNHGDWIPVATWAEGALELIKEPTEERSALLENILANYLGMKKKEKVRCKQYYFIESETGLDYSLAPSHPYGLAVNLFEKKDQAQQFIIDNPVSHGNTRVKQTNQLKEFLTRAADEGFAGAVFNQTEPIYFCLDPAENIVFLRLSLDEKSKVVETILEDNGSWSEFDGTADMEFFLDQDRCDRNMVKNLGNIPFLGHKTVTQVWTLELKANPEEPYVLTAEEGPYQGIPGGSAVLLFHQQENALEFMKERGLFKCEAVRVDNIRAMLERVSRRNLSVILEPFNHRAISGAIWLNGQDIILDSFSGFWVIREDWTFEKAV